MIPAIALALSPHFAIVVLVIVIAAFTLVVAAVVALAFALAFLGNGLGRMAEQSGAE